MQITIRPLHSSYQNPSLGSVMKKAASGQATKSATKVTKASLKKTTKSPASKAKVKKTAPKSKTKLTAWQTSWPATPDLRAWFLCGIQKCAANPKPEEGAIDAHLPIKALAELGYTAEALKHLQKFLKRVTKDSIVESTRLAELGAEICFEAGDMPGMEKYLELVRSADDRVTRKGDKGYGSKCVHDFKIANGLFAPGDLGPEHEDYIESIFYFHIRQLSLARQAKQKGQIKREFANLNEAIKREKPGWRKSMWTKRVIRLAHEMSNPEAIKQLIEQIPAEERNERIGYDVYAMIGLKKEATKFAQQEIEKNIEELLTMQDPNIHFPINGITRALTCLLEMDEKKLAAKLFKKVSESAASWSCVIQGWTTTAVLAEFVPIVEQLEGKQAAQELAALAVQHASTENHPGFKRGAQSTALAASASVHPLDHAIEQARKLRSPSQKRMELGKLLARAGRWKEMKEALSTVASPHEAARLAWWIKFELPGGEVV
jgi:tetratricopeptide (TPR) repeat protein